MHELSVIYPIVNMAVKLIEDNGLENVKTVNLAIGEVHDLQEEWIHKYYARFSKGTILEGTELVVRRIPIVLRCRQCCAERSFTHYTFGGADLSCPKCGCEKTDFISGRELTIEGIGYLRPCEDMPR